MSFQFIIYFNLALFLLGVFGILYSKDIVSLFISYQFIIISAAVNFLSFSKLLYKYSMWGVIFIIFGVVSIYFLMFCIIYYIYMKLDPLQKRVFYRNFRLFKITRSDWWGEDNL